MNSSKKALLTLLIGNLFISSLAYASVETLPKNIYEIKNTYNRYNVDKIGVVDPEIGAQGGKKWKTPADYKIKHIPSYIPLADPTDTLEVQIAEYYSIRENNVDLSVGLTDKLTIGMTLPFIRKELKYTKEFVEATKTYETMADGAYADYNIVSPRIAKVNSIGDITIGLKYRFAKSFALGFAYKGGLLNTGIDERERDYRDGVEELKTGSSATLLTYALYYDQKIKNHTIEWTAVYENSSVDYENSLDNVFRVNRGDTYTLNSLTTFKLSKKVSILPEFTYLTTEADYIQNSAGKFVKMKGSESQTLMGSLTLKYEPTEFFNVFIGYTHNLYQKLAVTDTYTYDETAGASTNGAYDFPGRLGIENFFKIGATLYLE